MKISIIYNPHAGTKDWFAQLRQAGNYLQMRGWQLSWCESAYAGHAVELARQAAQRGDDAAVAVGGDGTINEVMNGLVGTETALGVFPTGTGNVFAADMSIPLPGPLQTDSLLKAADVLLSGQMRRVDVAKATFGDGQTRYFLLWTGIGLDAAVSHAVEADQRDHPQMKSLGMAIWPIAAFFVLREFSGTRMKITLDQGELNRRVIMVSVSNYQLYGRFWRLSPEAKIDDGLLDVVVMEGYGFRSSLKHLALITLRQHVRDPEVHIFRARRLKIETRDPMPVHLDAENIGFTPLEIEVVPKSLKIILPQDAPLGHFVKQRQKAEG